MHINCDRYIVMMMIIMMITLKAFEKMNIMILMKIFKTINEKFGDNDLF